MRYRSSPSWIAVALVTAALAFCALWVYMILAPLRGRYLVVHGDNCWVVADRLHVNYDSGTAWWEDPETGKIITVGGARYTRVADGGIAEAAILLGARGCLRD